ncbi:MAG: NUDIX hydrolase [Candidatus Thalassarchaeaceae archaeon]|nr:NUDIX hydrolase [Candidatus Thalassarchaeaceae archaeon]
MANEVCKECGRDEYRNPAVTVDAVALRESSQGAEVLMIKRGPFPPEWEGKWAFPGGFVDYGENPEVAVIRELKEETGVIGENPVSLAILGEPGRDPRKHCVGLFYIVDVEPDSKPLAGDDAIEAAWVSIDLLTENNIAGDHINIIGMLIDMLNE